VHQHLGEYVTEYCVQTYSSLMFQCITRQLPNTASMLLLSPGDWFRRSSNVPVLEVRD
jgi:hypothetical protein